MWKRIVIVLAVVLGLILATCYVGYRKFTAEGNVAQVTIARNTASVFAMLSSSDSLPLWSTMVLRRIHVAANPNLLVGDTLVGMTKPRLPSDSSPPEKVLRWVIREIQPPNLLAMDAISPLDSTGQSQVIFSRRDSLVSQGDSTKIFSTFVSVLQLGPPPSAESDSTSKTRFKVLEQLMVSAPRAMMQADLLRLKTYLEKP